ncbi:hypothetical protein Tco_0739143 [Tanacetum coccineum]
MTISRNTFKIQIQELETWSINIEDDQSYVASDEKSKEEERSMESDDRVPNDIDVDIPTKFDLNQQGTSFDDTSNHPNNRGNQDAKANEEEENDKHETNANKESDTNCPPGFEHMKQSVLCHSHSSFTTNTKSDSYSILDARVTMDILQESNVKCDVNGDENTKLFHGFLKQKRRHQSIQGITVDGTWITDPHLVKPAFLNFFKAKFQEIEAYVSFDTLVGASILNDSDIELEYEHVVMNVTLVDSKNLIDRVSSCTSLFSLPERLKADNMIRVNQLVTILLIKSSIHLLDQNSLIHIRSCKSPTAVLFDGDTGRISICHCETKEYHSECSIKISRIMRRTLVTTCELIGVQQMYFDVVS